MKAAADKSEGHDPTSDQFLTGSAAHFLMKQGGASAADLWDPKKMAALQSKLETSQLSEALGGSANALSRVQGLLHDASYADTAVGVQGMDGVDPKSKDGLQRAAFLSKMHDTLTASGLKVGPGTDKVGEVQAFLKNEGNRNEAVEKLSRADSTIEDAQHNPVAMKALRDYNIKADADAETKKAEDLVGATRTTDDIMAGAFEYLFKWIKEPLDHIDSILNVHFGDNGDAAQAIGAGINSGQATEDIGMFDRKLADLKKLPKSKKRDEDIARYTKDREGMMRFIREKDDPYARSMYTSIDASEYARLHGEAPKEYGQYLNTEDSTKLFGKMGLNMTKGAMPNLFDAKLYDKFAKDINNLDPKLYKLVTTGAIGAPDTTYHIEINNVSVGAAALPKRVDDAVKRSGNEQTPKADLPAVVTKK